jgi:ABC-2 type transport system permease protein
LLWCVRQAACRNLFGGNVPTPDTWPMQHPELTVLISSVALIAVFAPTAVHLYRRKVLR